MDGSTIGSALRIARTALGAGARLDAEVLLAHLLAEPRSALYRAPERVLDAAVLARYEALVAARARGMPVPYLTGACEFWSLPLTVTPAVLVPRADTETLVEVALELVPAAAAPVVVDLGTGSGAIASAIAHERPRARVLATDRDAAALAVARRNFRALALDRIALVQGDWLAPLVGHALDVVVANPPYVATADGRTLPPELAFEPAGALYAGPDGLAAFDALVPEAGRRLRSGAWLVLEHGAEQAEAVAARCAAHGFTAIETRPDLGGRARVTRARRS